MVKEIDIEGGSVGYSVTEDAAIIEYYRGRSSGAFIPDTLEDKPITELKKKAFVGAKALTKVSLPGSITSIGDYAFASCSNLKSLEIRSDKISFLLGLNVFKDCEKLESLDTTMGGEINPRLLGAILGPFDAQYLFDPEEIGKKQWYEGIDARVLQLMHADDGDGFSKMLLCGEEDYVGDDSNLEVYESKRRCKKVGYALLRLMQNDGISSACSAELGKYLRDHMGDESHAETWKVILEEHGSEAAYFDLLLEYDCIRSDNIDRLIESMGDRYPSMKGYLIRQKGENMKAESFFSDMDW